MYQTNCKSPTNCQHMYTHFTIPGPKTKLGSGWQTVPNPFIGSEEPRRIRKSAQSANKNTIFVFVVDTLKNTLHVHHFWHSLRDQCFYMTFEIFTQSALALSTTCAFILVRKNERPDPKSVSPEAWSECDPCANPCNVDRNCTPPILCADMHTPEGLLVRMLQRQSPSLPLRHCLPKTGKVSNRELFYPQVRHSQARLGCCRCRYGHMHAKGFSLLLLLNVYRWVSIVKPCSTSYKSND